MYMIIGCNGQLGSEFYSFYPKAVGMKHSHVAVESPDIIEAIKSIKPTVVINCSAYHNLDQCELNPRIAFDVNAVGCRNLAMACHAIDAKLVHFSTDYVFDGESKIPYEETDEPIPLQVYGISKLSGEQMIAAYHDDYIIARISAVFGKYKCRAKEYNFPQLMMKNAREHGKLTVVDDQFVTPTYTYNLVRQIDLMIQNELSGMFHVTNRGTVSWYDFTRKILEVAGIQADVVSCSSKPTEVKRPKFSALYNSALELLGMNEMWGIETALEHYINGIHKEL